MQNSSMGNELSGIEILHEGDVGMAHGIPPAVAGNHSGVHRPNVSRLGKKDAVLQDQLLTAPAVRPATM